MAPDAPREAVTLTSCPHCRSTDVTPIGVGDDYRTITIKCKVCARISIQPYPPTPNS